MATTRTAPNGFMNTRSAVLGISRAAFLGLRWASAAPLAATQHGGGGDEPEAEGPGLVMMYILSMVLVLAGGAFAGLTIAFMGQDGIYLKVLKDDIHESQLSRKSAARVLNLLDKGKHWVLVTLLLANVIVNESLPVVLDRCLGGGVAAIVGSTVLIVIFGEVVPQSVCVRYGLTIGGFMSGPVLLLMWLTAPISWPIAKLLDWILGTHEGTIYKKSGLKTLVTLHQTMGEISERLNTDEVTIIRAVLDLKAKSVNSIMTPMGDVFTLSASAILDEELMDQILSAGYSRIPVYSPDNSTNYIGMLLVKILITYDPEDCMQVKDFPLAALPETGPDTSCLDILNYFQDGKSHMAIVSQAPGKDHGAIGVVTLEDVIEELIGEEIVDESDVYIDVHKAIRRLAPAPTTTFRRRESMKTDSEDAGRQTDQESRRSQSISAQGGTSSGSPKTATFMMKRRSTGPGAESSTVPVKHNVDQVKKHLSRHLSPSNPAANPKNIKSSTVTIKPGSGAATTPSSRQFELTLEPDDLETDNERAPLLGSKPAATASDTTLHATPNYGSSAPGDSKNGAQVDGLNLGDSVEIHPSENAVSRAAKDDLEEARRYGNPSSETLESAESPGMPAPFRTGSITESYVQAGGVRKIVISSSSGDEDDVHGGEPSGPTNSTSEPVQGVQEADASGAAQGNGSAEQASEAETHGDEAGEGASAQGSSAQQGGGQGKKKKKGKKNKGKK